MLGVVTPFWRRYPMARVLMAHLARMAEDVPLYLVACTDEPEIEALAKMYGWHVCHVGNDNLAAKINAGALSLRGVEGIHGAMGIGTDNFHSASLFRHWLASDCRWGGLLDYYFLNAEDGELLRWTGYPASGHRYGETVGAGRFYSRALLEETAWQPWNLDRWAAGVDGGLRTKVGPEDEAIRMADVPCIGIDVKDGDGLTPFWKVRRCAVAAEMSELAGLDEEALADLRALYPAVRA